MKAWMLHGIHDFTYEDTSIPVLKDGEVLVQVKSAGICGSDIPRIYRDGAHQMPLIPGHEFAGEVVQVGKWVDDAWMQKRVGVYPLIPCKECDSCRKGYFEMCKNYSYIGSRQNGAFAEFVAVPAQNLIALPNTVSYEQAAMLEPMAVAVHAMQQVNPAQTSTVAVCGLGTIGLLLTMFLLEKGIRNVLVIGNKSSQKRKAQELGLSEDNYCDSIVEDVLDWCNAKTNRCGVDVVFECVGKSATFSQCIEIAAPKGTVCLIGNPYSDMCLEKSVYWKILRNQLTVVGTWNSSFFKSIHNSDAYGYYKEVTDWEYVLHKLESGSISPEKLISHKTSLEEMETVLQMMRDKTEEYIKIMIVTEENYGKTTTLFALKKFLSKYFMV